MISILDKDKIKIYNPGTIIKLRLRDPTISRTDVVRLKNTKYEWQCILVVPLIINTRDIIITFTLGISLIFMYE